MKRIILFGGTFDPIHFGHLKIAAKAYDVLKADQVIFILAKKPRWKTPSSSSEDRLNMLNLALEGYRNFEVSLIEYNSEDEVNYTIDTVEKLIDDKAEYFYLIGSDQVEKLNQWYKIDELSKMIKFVAFKRPEIALNQENIDKYHVQVIKSKKYDISSTELRFMHNLDAPKEVLDYIAEHNLYYIKTIKELISKERFKHTLSVANLAYRLALQNNADPLKAYIAGLLHDIAKDVNTNTMLEYIKKEYPQYLEVPEMLYHQFMSAKMATEIFQVNDEDILEAIKYHGTGNEMMSPLAKILYVADKTDPLRGYDSTYLIKESQKDINQGFKLVLEDNIRYYQRHQINYHNILTDQCIAYYLKEDK